MPHSYNSGMDDNGNRVGRYDWSRLSAHIDECGWAVVDELLTRDECGAIAGLYPDDRLFRSHIVMARHGFGRGEYKYFADPLPALIKGLRRSLYEPLVSIANRWNAAMGIDVQYPNA